MKSTRSRRMICFLLCALLCAVALFAAGCAEKSPAPAASDSASDAASAEAEVLGTGGRVFAFTVTHADGREKAYEIHTDRETVGDALLDLGLIAGEAGDFGLYVKTVDGVTLDYAKDKQYWAFYENSRYAAHGVSETEITDGAAYALRAES